MRGGIKVYAGSPAAARCYLDADRGRADDYYLAEGIGLARRYATGPDSRVQELAPLAGGGYEAWVAGQDPDTGESRGWLRSDERAVRFVEVVVNGPKSWSLASALHPDVAAAYDAAQDRAAAQLIGWLAEHATTRVGPRGGQVQVPVEVLEAVTVRHYTSRAGDPHRHLHLQVNARVFATEKWRGLHTVAVRDFLAAINGIGHAAVACDPQFRGALASHGYTSDSDGEIRQMSDVVGPFSARATQIARNVDRYESRWTAAHPGETPGPALRRAWDARAWADGRPDKVTPQPGEDLTARWMGELTALGYRDRDRPVDLAPTPVGALDRDGAVGRVLARLAAGRSAWNAADVRGEVEQLIAAAGVVAESAVRIELAEDLTARALVRCVPLLDRDGVPEHIRALTCRQVLDVEAELTVRLADRATGLGVDLTDADLSRLRDEPIPPGRGPTSASESLAQVHQLDAGQAAAVAALAGDRQLVVVEGAAGAGKTTTLTATRTLLDEQGQRLTVVAPTLKAAQVVQQEVGADAGSVAWLVHQHGWRWTDEGAWTRLAAGQTDPVTGSVHTGPEEEARLRAGDLLVVDVAGMLDQDTARALLTVADECRVRVALLGDRRQLTAVGRGGVLELAVRAVDPTAVLTLDRVHRFIRTDGGFTVADTEYAELTLAMRAGTDPGTVFDALAARGQVRLHPDAAAMREELADTATRSSAEGEPVAVVVDTREQAAALNAAVRERLVADRRVEDTRVVVTAAGQRIGVGDRVATRRNDRDLGVANRDTWTVTTVDGGGGLVVTPAARAGGNVTSAGVTPAGSRQRTLPADYVTAHVELAYASTAHGVQGDTVPAAHLVIGESTGAAGAYVGMTRGRQAHIAHLVAADADEAREQWIAVFARDRADLGPAHAAEQAAAEAASYASPRPLEQVLAELHQAWSVEQRCADQLALLEPWRDTLRQVVAQEAGHAGELTRLDAEWRQTALVAERAKQTAQASTRAVAAKADRIRDSLLTAWDGERPAARVAARVVLDGPGRLQLRRAAVARASQQLTGWADRWRPHRPDLPTDPTQLAQEADGYDDRAALWQAFDTAARRPPPAAPPSTAIRSRRSCMRLPIPPGTPPRRRGVPWPRPVTGATSD
ncbi:MobF family relaxase [Geodermatophilus sp. FMUSA9-8]|uniref:MobF family relaxase n=1 Tax=Geodermatophilus sp. FMUSA9-8 TaxID=3120155 RepID=UPI003FA53428